MDNSSYQKGIESVQVRLVKEPKLFPRRLVRDTEDAIRCLREEMSSLDREAFYILNLRTDGSVINVNCVSIGTLNATLLTPREIFKGSILSNAAGIIMLHNHPSGNVKPSRDDYLVTKRIVDSGKLLDIRVVDHVIIGCGSLDYYSFARHDDLDNLDDILQII